MLLHRLGRLVRGPGGDVFVLLGLAGLLGLATVVVALLVAEPLVALAAATVALLVVAIGRSALLGRRERARVDRELRRLADRCSRVEESLLDVEESVIAQVDARLLSEEPPDGRG